MTLTEAIVLGTVQGLGEFLPISSSAHLVIVPWLFNFPDPGLSFDVALHLGTLISLLAFFWRDWLKLSGAFFSSLKKSPRNYNPDERLIWMVILATIPGAIAGYLIEDYAETILRTPLLVGIMMVVMGLILLIADRIGKKQKNLLTIGLKDSLIVGCSQALALLPGTSRSGVTITAGLFLGMDRPTAARFSFLLSMPITLGAVLLKFPDFIKGPIAPASLVGIFVSGVVGYLAIKYMLYFLQRYTYAVYVVYRFIFAAVVLIVVFLRASK